MNPRVARAPSPASFDFDPDFDPDPDFDFDPDFDPDVDFDPDPDFDPNPDFDFAVGFAPDPCTLAPATLIPDLHSSHDPRLSPETRTAQTKRPAPQFS